MEEPHDIEQLMELKRRRRARRRPWVRLKKHIIYFSAINLVRLLDSLSRPATLSLGRFLGWLFSVIPNPHFKRAVRHLRYAFPDRPEKELTHLARKTFINLARTVAETTMLRHTHGRYGHLVRHDSSVEILEKTLAKGRGCVVIATHVGCWELLVGYLSNTWGIHVVKKFFKFDKFSRVAEEMRASNLIRVIDVTQWDRMKAAVDANEPIVILPDLDMKKENSLPVEFFGREAPVVRGPALLALRNRTPIVCAFPIWNSHHHVLTCLGPIEIPAGGTTEENQLEVSRAFMQNIEQMITKHPEQWVWFHTRWKQSMQDEV
jgi:KDO2-lipid IV(A) lauroyltransferase